MKLQKIVSHLNEIFCIKNAENFDNVGLLCGNLDREITGALVCHDTLGSVVDEAIDKGLNLIVSFHPIIFSGLKSITGKNYVEKSVLKAIENKIAIYAIHTAFDNDYFGVNYKICEALGLQNQKILIPKQENLKKLEVYVPVNYTESVKNAILEAGAGSIGFYDECSFSIKGEGTFRAKEGANPFIGSKNIRENVEETLITFVFEGDKQNAILREMKDSHPYEEVAHQIIKIENENPYIGLGRYGDLITPLSEEQFLYFVKDTFNLKVIRHSSFLGKEIRRVGVLGGSGTSGIGMAKRVGCDAYLTGDYKYHDFFQAENEILLCDIGHFESEQFIVQQIFEKISKKIPNFAVYKTSVNTNPVNYFL
jgi:dinuclear metal center protein, YbgI family